MAAARRTADRPPDTERHARRSAAGVPACRAYGSTDRSGWRSPTRPGPRGTSGRRSASAPLWVSRAVQVEHVGSTSVPGLAAKPVIDVVLTVRDSADEAAYAPDLAAAGYLLVVREPAWYEHRFLRNRDADVQIHVFTAGSPEVDRMLAFRDRLRARPEERDLYERTKRELAAPTLGLRPGLRRREVGRGGGDHLPRHGGVGDAASSASPYFVRQRGPCFDEDLTSARRSGSLHTAPRGIASSIDELLGEHYGRNPARGISRRRFLQGTAAASLGTAATAAGIKPAAADPLGPRSEPHGAELRGLDLVTQDPTAEGRFGYMFKNQPPHGASEDLLTALGQTMEEKPVIGSNLVDPQTGEPVLQNGIPVVVTKDHNDALEREPEPAPDVGVHLRRPVRRPRHHLRHHHPRPSSSPTPTPPPTSGRPATTSTPSTDAAPARTRSSTTPTTGTSSWSSSVPTARSGASRRPPTWSTTCRATPTARRSWPTPATTRP